MPAGVGHQPNAIEDPTAARGAQAQGADGTHFASWGNPRGGGRAGGGLKPKIKGTIGGDRPPRLGGELLALKICVNFSLLTRSTSSRCIPQTKWRRPGTREDARAGRFGQPNAWWLTSSMIASLGSTSPRGSYCKDE